MSTGNAPYYMGIDVGTSETKGLLIERNCRIVLQSSIKHSMEHPKPGQYEHDAERVWWHDLCIVANTLIRDSGVEAKEIAALGISTLGSDCLPVDETCKPLRKAILYGIDSRAQEEIEWLTNYYGTEEVNRLFGRPICTGDVAAKILWIKHHEPEIYKRTYKFLTGSSYLVARLTGKYVIDQFLSQASFRPLYRKDGSICEEECQLYCSPEQLAQTMPASDIAGFVTKEASLATGLAEGTPVITGTGDSSAEAISTGVLAPGDMMIQFGSTLFLYYCSAKPVQDERMRGNNFLIPGTYSLAGGTNTCGAMTQWYRDILFSDYLQEEQQGGKNAFARMPEGIEEIAPGSEGLITLPYFAGERTPINDPKARGMIFGLTLSHTRKHLYRSALESVGYSVRQHLEVLRDHDLPLKKLMAVGGGTKSAVWMQIVSDIIGLPISVSEVSVGAAFGDALMAALGTGRFNSFRQLNEVITTARIYQPDQERHRQYERYYKLYCELYNQTKNMMHRIGEVENVP